MKRKRAADALRRREVQVILPFRESFARLAEHYKTLQALFPDSGSRLAAFNEDLFERIVPALERNANAGRPYALRKLGSEDEAVLLAEIAPVACGGLRGCARMGRARIHDSLYRHAVSRHLKHHRQLGY